MKNRLAPIDFLESCNKTAELGIKLTKLYNSEIYFFLLIEKYFEEDQIFDVNKLINSLWRSRVDDNVVQDIAQKIQEQIEEGMVLYRGFVKTQRFKMI